MPVLQRGRGPGVRPRLAPARLGRLFLLRPAPHPGTGSGLLPLGIWCGAPHGGRTFLGVGQQRPVPPQRGNQRALPQRSEAAPLPSLLSAGPTPGTKQIINQTGPPGLKGTAPPAGRPRAALDTADPPHPARAAPPCYRAAPRSPRGRSPRSRRVQVRRGPLAGPAPAPPSESQPRATPCAAKAPELGAAHLDADRPPESGRGLAAARLRAPPQPAASSAAGAPRPAAPLARCPRAPPLSPPLAAPRAPPTPRLRPLVTYAEPFPWASPLAPRPPRPRRRPGVGGARRRGGPRAPGSTRAPNPLTARKSAAFRGAGGAWGRCLAAFPG